MDGSNFVSHSVGDGKPPIRLVLRKGRKLPIGTVRIWNGKKMQKKGPGQWVPVASGKTGGKGAGLKAQTVLRASAINVNYANEWSEKNRLKLVGQTFKSSDDLAYLAECYRNPQFETFRILFTKAVQDGYEVVAQTGITCRLPSSATTLIDPADKNSTFSYMKEMMKSSGADGYVLLHNHPSGEVKASNPDIEMTKNFAAHVSGFVGHMVIDHKKYSMIDSGGNVETHDMGSVEPDPFLNQNPRGVIGEHISGPTELVKVVKAIETIPEKTTLIGTSKSGVRAIMDIPNVLLDDMDAGLHEIREFAINTGSQGVFLANLDKDAKHYKFYLKALAENYVVDVVIPRRGSGAKPDYYSFRADPFSAPPTGPDDIEFGVDVSKVTPVMEEAKKSYAIGLEGLDKARKFPVGTVREWKGEKYRKTSDKGWVHIGQGRAKTGTKLVAGESVQKVKKSYGLTEISKHDFDNLISQTTRKDRIAGGQKVSYVGNYHQKYRGQKGTLVATGYGGEALIQMSDGNIINSRWKNVKADGMIKGFSVYDGLAANNVHTMDADLRGKVDAIMDTKIGGSRYTYRDLCAEFKKAGFTLFMVGGTIRDLLKGTPGKDIDFVVDCTDNELEYVIRGMAPKWVATAKRNKKLGLFSIEDGTDIVDITPMHTFSPEIMDCAKGWLLKNDAQSRDFTMNSLQCDPLAGYVIDGSGSGIADIKTGILEFADPEIVDLVPRYLLRAFKFLGRGYTLSKAAGGVLRKKLNSIKFLREDQLTRFLDNQVYQKDGEVGLRRYKQEFQKYDDQGLWGTYMEKPFQDVLQRKVV